MLVPAGRTTSAWATPDGSTLASFDAGFGVLNPSRYANTDATIGRTLPLCWETAADGDKADGVDCSLATQLGLDVFDDPRSPFDGTRRDVYLAGTTVMNAGGTDVSWTDPAGGNAQATPFPGAVCQLVSTTDQPQDATVRGFGRNRSHDAVGVHAPT